MAVTLLRRQSDTPTVQGSDDSRILRYAVAGYNGITKGYANECGYEISGTQFKIKSGEIIADGWQAIIDSMGMSIQTNSSSTKLFYTVYIEYDLRVAEFQKVDIKSMYNTDTYPAVQSGDDLTQNSFGVRRLALYNFTTQNSILSNVTKIVSYCEIGNAKNVTESINGKTLDSIFESDGVTVKKSYIATYASSDIVKGTIEDRLNKLGFRSGKLSPKKQFSNLNGNLDGVITREGNRVLMNFSLSCDSIYVTTDHVVFITPTWALPKSTIPLCIGEFTNDYNSHGLLQIDSSGQISILPDGGSTAGYVTKMLSGYGGHRFAIGYEAQEL